VKADLVAQYGLPAEKIAIVNPPPVTAVYARLTKQELQEAKERLQFARTLRVLPSPDLGHKNHVRLFEALKILRDRGLIVPLVCSGHQNEQFPRLRENADRLGVGSDVRFLGFLDARDVQLSTDLRSLLFFPSLYEGWGLPIVEARQGFQSPARRQHRCPNSLATQRSMFDPLDAGAIASAIERLWMDEEVRTDLVDRGHARAREFDWYERRCSCVRITGR